VPLDGARKVENEMKGDPPKQKIKERWLPKEILCFYKKTERISGTQNNRCP
jgi:hypothetical protein